MKVGKRVVVMLSALMLLGLCGLTLAVVDLNHLYGQKRARLQRLHGELQTARNRLARQQAWATLQRQRIRQLDSLEFKLSAFSKRYPLFARIVDAVQQQSPRYGLHPALVMSVMQVESGFNPFAVSLAGAYGLMQVRYCVWKDELHIDRSRLFDVEYNIELGLKILRTYLRESRGDVRRALALYNNGYGHDNPGYPQKVSQSLYCLDLPMREMARGVSE